MMIRLCLTAMLTVVALAGVDVNASDPPVFYSGGKAHTLEVSTDEFYVVTNRDKAQSVRAKIAEDPQCAVRSLPWAKRADHHCIVHVDQANSATRSRITKTAGVESVRPVYRVAGSNAPLLSSGNIVIRLSPEMSAEERTEFFSDFKLLLVNTIDAQRGVYAVKPQSGDDEFAHAAAMYTDDRTLFSHPDFVVETTMKQVFGQFNDEFLDQQWHLNNTGQGGGTVGADINVEGAWGVTFGEDVLIGMLDDSADVQHDDLLPNYLGIGHDAFNAIESSSAPNPRNIDDFHGTAVMGLAVADANDVGVIGVAPASQWTASRAINDPATLGQLASAFTFARQREVQVHNNSWGLVGIQNSQADVIVSAIEGAYEEGRDNRGMVIVFAAGNDAQELGIDDDLSTLSTVFGVGASNANDEFVDTYSNFGTEIDVLAPSADAFLPGMVTTDNTDSAGFASPGLNSGGVFFDQFGNALADLPEPDYTQYFSGTSASAPVVAGLAALVISANQELTVGQVRTVIEQTCVKVDAPNALYHPITERSLTHAYGRIDASAAVNAASLSVDNGGFTWPQRLNDVRITGNTIAWTLGDDLREIDEDDDPETDPIVVGERTSATLVVESVSPFSDSNVFIPTDGETYSVGQVVAAGISVVHNSPATAFGTSVSGATRYYALFPSNAIGRYGFGVTIDTEGNTVGLPGGDVDTGGGGPSPTTSKPRPTINVTPLSGTSPLEVRFQGNAHAENEIESMIWDFGDGTVSDRATTSHVYTVSGTESETFFPTFIVTDVFDNVGSRSVAITVSSPTGGDDDVSTGNIRIQIGLPGSPGSNVSSGVSPFNVELNIAGSPAGDIQSVAWDLGDGTTADTVAVPHEYTNYTQGTQTFPISVNVMSTTSTGTVRQNATRFITVGPDPNPPAEVDDNGGDNGDGGDDGDGGEPSIPGTCGGVPIGMIAMSFFTLTLVRRRVR